MERIEILGELARHLWQSTLFALAAGLLTLAFRRNRAQVRYWLWFSASIRFFIPFWLLIGLGGHIGSTPAVHQIATRIAAPAVAFVADEVAQVSFVSSAPRTVDWVPIAILVLWACGFAAIVLMRLRGWRRIRAVVDSGVRIELPASVEVRSCEGVLEPAVVGLLHPILVLPVGLLENLTAAQLQAVLAHELCHVRRRDNLLASIHMIVEALFWFHPLVWWIGARLVEERERACDEEVLSQLGEPRIYAEGILNVCKLYIESPLVCVSGVTGGGLKRRIEEIMRNHIGRSLTGAHKLGLVGAAAAALAIPLVVGVGSAPEIRAQSPRFDVASVKPSKPGEQQHFNFPLGPGNVYVPNGGYLSATGVPLSTYIYFAYRIMGNQYIYLRPTLPEWARSERFDIQARAEGNPSKDQMRLMMRSLLADRFKLAIHSETREVPVLALVLLKSGKTGPQLKVHTGDSPCPTNAPASPGAASEQTPSFDGTVPGGFPALCGGILDMPPSAPGRMRFGGRNLTMEFIADSLASLARQSRPLLDQTGLSGTFDFNIEWTPERSGADPSAADAEPDPSGATFEQALRDQLGIKLESRKGPLNVFIIDHIEHPSEN